MLDEKLSKLNENWVSRFVEKTFKDQLSANHLTLIGLGLGIVSALLIFLTGYLEWESGFHLALTDFWGILSSEGWNAAWTGSETSGSPLFGWKWMKGDSMILGAAIVMSISFLFDVFDGAMARIEGPSDYGGVLDIFCDRSVEVILIISIVSNDPIHLGLSGTLALGSIVVCITIFLLVGGKIDEDDVEQMPEKKKVIYYAGGLMERTETFIFIFLMLVFGPFREFLLYLFAGLVFITALQRLFHARKLLK